MPAWNEALGLPRPWDQQWSLRMQQILAYETDLLEYGDIFDGSVEIARKVDELKRAALDELSHIERLGGAIAAVEMGYMKRQLVESNSQRLEAIERGELIVVGVNKFKKPSRRRCPPAKTRSSRCRTRSRPSRSRGSTPGARSARPDGGRGCAHANCGSAARDGRNIMPASIVCAKAGVTTGEWGEVLRDDFGEYRAPTGVGRAARNDSPAPDDLRAEIDRVSRKLGRRLKFLVGKPGLDGHSNGAEQIAVRARDAGMDVVYEGIRLTPAEIVEAAREQKAHVVGLSILSGSHVPLVSDVVARMKDAGLDDMPVVVGGIIPPEDAETLQKAGVAAVYTPKDFELNRIMTDCGRRSSRRRKARTRHFKRTCARLDLSRDWRRSRDERSSAAPAALGAAAW